MAYIANHWVYSQTHYIRLCKHCHVDIFNPGKRPKLSLLEKHVIEHVAHKWYELAIQFGFDKDGAKASQIRRNHITRGGVLLCCREAFLEWLRGKGRKPPSWKELIDCLEAIECNDLAERLRIQIPGE